MNRLKNKINRVADYLDDNMEKIMGYTQLGGAIVMMLCVLISVIGHIIMGHITSFLGIIVSGVFIYLVYQLLRISWQELQESKNK